MPAFPLQFENSGVDWQRIVESADFMEDFAASGRCRRGEGEFEGFRDLNAVVVCDET